jgi:hypothetical protein
MRLSPPFSFPALAFLITAAGSGLALGAALTPGNLIVLRVGDGSAVLTSAAAAVFLDEYSLAGSLVQSIPLPSTGTSALTMVGTGSTEGILNRTQAGNKIVFGGYRKAAGGTNPASDAPSTVTNRVIAQLSLDGSVNTSLELSDTSGTIRSVTSIDGSGPFYIGTSAAVRYAANPVPIVTPPGPGVATTTISIDARNSRQVYLSGNTLFASNGSTTITGKLQHYGILPTATKVAAPIASLALADAVNGFWMTDLSPTVPGDDTVYIISTVENLIRKFSYDGTTWTSNSTATVGGLGVQNVTGSVTNGVPTLYLTSASRLYAFTDNTGYNGSLSGTLGTSIASSPTNTAFRGISSFLISPPKYQFVGTTLAAATVTVRLTGTEGRPPTIQASDNLQSWATVGTAAETTAGNYSLLDPASPVPPRRFYRIAP